MRHHSLRPTIRTGWFSVVVCALALCFSAGKAFAACELGISKKSPLLHFTATQGPGAVAQGTVRIRYIGHSSFLITSPKGVTAVTDYNGFQTPGFAPDIVTMNNSHESHYTESPEPGIRHVLRGWSPGVGKGMARHNIRIRDMKVFNVPTNIGEYGDPKGNGNSIFVFEISNLCIAHLGHLHHVLTREQLLRLGRVDILFVPVDGGMTITHPQAIAVIKQIEPRLVLPMHFGFMGAPDLFFEQAKSFWTIRSAEDAILTVSRRTLPKTTEILFLQASGF